MRRLTGGILTALLVLLTFGVPMTAAVGPANPKVVLIVGATHGTTPTYRAWMDQVYATVRQYTTNVVRVYSPNATWSAAKAALQGASVVVYMGHGNGFPSPYRTTIWPYSMDGLGLNATAGAGDSNTTYYGEYYLVRDVRLAPNAVVILSHLCYASGNSEPGKAAPSLSVARQRMDNFGAGFIKAGARAVIADGHGDPSYYIDQLFASHQTVDQIFRGKPWADGPVYTFASSRLPGFTVEYDPDQDSPVAGFYRSMVSRPTLRTDDITGARFAPTDGDPGWFVVPGAAEVSSPGGAGLYGDAGLSPDPGTGLAPATLPAGTRLRLTATSPAVGGVAVYAVTTLDGSASGFARATDLVPRDSASPMVNRLAVTPAVISPAVPGSIASIVAVATEQAAWTATVTDPQGAVVATSTGSGRTFSSTWDGRATGSPAPDATYTVTVSAQDPWGNAPGTASATVRVDTTPPVLSAVAGISSNTTAFSPNGDGNNDPGRVAYTASEPGSLHVTVRDGLAAVVDAWDVATNAGLGTVTWDGRNAAGSLVPDGPYTVELAPIDLAGNAGSPVTASVRAYAAIRAVASAPTIFFPIDNDAYSKTAGLSFTLVTPATVGWRIVNGAGATVRTILAGSARAAGPQLFAWNGRTDAGTYAPRGQYRSVVSATDGTATVTESTVLTIEAFRIAASDATPARRQRITYTVTTVEPLRVAPIVGIMEPGRARVGYRTTRISSTVYRVTVPLVGWRTGTLSVRVTGLDAGGHYNVTYATYRLH